MKPADKSLTRVLLVEDNVDDANHIAEILREAHHEHFEVEHIAGLDAALERVSMGDIDLMLLDLTLPESHELDTLIKVHECVPALPVVVLTGESNEELGLRAVQEGAQDYLVKGQVDSRLLPRAMRYAIERKRSKDKVQQVATNLEKNNRELQDVLDKVSRLEQLKTDMIRIASHDLGGMVGIILGYCDLLHADLWDQLSEEHRHWIADIESTATRMRNLTRNILTLERIEAGLEMESLDLNLLVAEVFVHRRTEAEAKNQSIALVTPDDLLLVNGDIAQLREAITNLIGNAIKYTPAGGTITVSLERDGERAVFEVRDTGYGIPAGLQDHLFQPFFRATTDETREIKGTGLGLHLVKNIIERHRGRMRFRSVYGEGSMFGFDLPLLD